MLTIPGSLRSKILGGFAVVALAVGAAATYGALRIGELADEVPQLGAMSRDALLVSEINADMAKANLNMREYLASHRGEDLDEARRYVAEVRAGVETGLKQIADPARRDGVSGIRQKIDAFESGVARLQTLQNDRHALVNGDLMGSGTAMRVALSEMNDRLSVAGNFNLANNVARLQESVLLARIYKHRFLLSNAENDLARTQSELAEVNMGIEGLRPSLTSAGQSAGVAAFEAALKTYAASVSRIRDIISERNKVRTAILDELGTSVGASAAGIKQSAVASFEQRAAQAEAGATASQWRVKIAVGVGLLLALVLGGLLARSITRPVIAITGQMKDLAAGETDMDIEGKGRADEIGRMAEAVEVFRQNAIERKRLEAEAAIKAEEDAARTRNMETAIAGFQTAVDRVLASVDQNTKRMDMTAGDLGSIAERAKSEAAAAAGASEETSTTIQTVAAAAEELAASVNEISRQVQGATHVVRSATATTDRSVAEIEGLAQAAQRIGDVVGMIQGIAAQTNLLALNATIEAARAGESGRGFAVVASEVKTLAGQTAKATEEIAQQISGIQNSTRSAVDAIRQITAGMREIDQVTTAIAAAVEEQGVATREISQNVAMAAQGTEILASNVGSVATSIDQTNRSSVTVRGASGELAAGAGQLAEEIRNFFLALRNGPMDRRKENDPDYRGPERRADQSSGAMPSRRQAA
jgi:methyl-accepting chemotaxis protein